MTKIYLTEKQQAQLKCHPNVQAVSEKTITIATITISPT